MSKLRRRLLTSTLGVALAAVLVFAAGLAISTGSRLGGMSAARFATIALSALVVAAGLGLAQARRLARPVRDLAKAADRVGSGDARPVGRRYGIAELDRIADGLDSAVQRVIDLISAEQDFAVDASHQLRTPLTALSMRLEEMVEAADDPEVVKEEGAAALAQTDRLTQVVSQLLGRARRSSSGAPALSNIAEIIDQQVSEWEPAFRSEGRKIEVLADGGNGAGGNGQGGRGRRFGGGRSGAGDRGGPGGAGGRDGGGGPAGGGELRAYVSVGGVSQVIATLLDNALVHGGGTVSIRTSHTPRSVVIEVKDEGKGVPADLVNRIFERSVSGAGGTGLGLALAKSVAASDGGQLLLVKPRPATFAVIYPQPIDDRIDEPAVVGPA